jgi:zinc transporter ZupT
MISALAAFGAGALIAALSVELVAPTVMAIGPERMGGVHANPVRDLYGLIGGAIIGGILFVLLDQLVNARGGFLRKKATVLTYYAIRETKRKKRLIEQLSNFPLLHDLPPDHIATLISRVRPVSYLSNEIIARQGTMVGNLLFILHGTLRVSRDGTDLREMKPGEVLGMAALLTGIPAPGAATAVDNVSGLLLSESDFKHLREVSSEFNEACRLLTEKNLDYLENFVLSRTNEAVDWKRSAFKALEQSISVPGTAYLRKEKEEHKGAGMAIWLGILLDGIPESFVIGGGLLVSMKAREAAGMEFSFGNIIPYTLIAGLFLSNFPEALSSSATMKAQLWSKRKILTMWSSLMVITGIGAGCGFILVEEISHTALIFIEGLASGAMLTMIASSMIPEAVHLGKANLAGLSTLAGFLAAISFKLLE